MARGLAFHPASSRRGVLISSLEVVIRAALRGGADRDEILHAARTTRGVSVRETTAILDEIEADGGRTAITASIARKRRAAAARRRKRETAARLSRERERVRAKRARARERARAKRARASERARATSDEQGPEEAPGEPYARATRRDIWIAEQAALSTLREIREERAKRMIEAVRAGVETTYADEHAWLFDGIPIVGYTRKGWPIYDPDYMVDLADDLDADVSDLYDLAYGKSP